MPASVHTSDMAMDQGHRDTQCWVHASDTAMGHGYGPRTIILLMSLFIVQLINVKKGVYFALIYVDAYTFRGIIFLKKIVD